MQTIDLELAKGKLATIAKALDGTCLFTHNPLTSYFAAKAARDAMRRVGHEHRLATVKRALKSFNVTVGTGIDARELRRVRVWIPTKQLEILL